MQQASCVDTPAQNGRVERKHRQLLSIARALRFQSGLPISYWGDCILAATYIINRLPSPVLHYKSPYECLYHVLPDYSLFKVFGCLCYASIHENDKFHPRAIRSVFLGYPFGHKGYKLLNLETRQQFISRHVVFHETAFPFLDNTHTTTPSDPYHAQHWFDVEPPSSGPVCPVDSNPVLGSPPISYTNDNVETSPFESAVSDSESQPWSTSPPDHDTLVNLQ